MTDTQLSRMLAASDRRPDALSAFKIARRQFMAGKRIEMRELAAELGVNRATLFRWVGNRDELLAEILWSLAEPTLADAAKEAEGRGGARIASIIKHFSTAIDRAEYFREFLQREPERAIRIMMTRAGAVQGRVVAGVEALIAEELEREPADLPLPPHDLAYLIVRISESFLYADIIAGEEPAPDKVEQAIKALLT